MIMRLGCVKIIVVMLLCGVKWVDALDITFIRSVATPHSILLKKEHYKPLFVGARLRYATCTGATWFHGNHLAVLNLYGQELMTYIFDEQKKEFKYVQHINNQQGARLGYPEQMTVSHDGKFLAVANGKNFGVQVYTIDPDTHLINPTSIFSLPARGLVHNVRFSSDDVYIAYVSFDRNESVCIYKIVHDASTIGVKCTYKNVHDSNEVKAKGIMFTHDSRYAVLVYSCSASWLKPNSLHSVIKVHRFNASAGVLEEEVSRVDGSFCVEDLALVHNDTSIVVTDQANDMLLVYPFNAHTGQIGKEYTVLQNPDAHLSFPHGIAVSGDGTYMVVTNYGDDTFNLYQVS
jgi:6-phosphogluconolactonase (cycloisomerase 2 family)